MVLPFSTCKSGPPIMYAVGTGISQKQRREESIEFSYFSTPLDRSLSVLAIPTDHLQIDKVTLNGLRRDLTLVLSGVPFLNPFNLQRPVVGLLVMRRLKPLVGGVRVRTHSQNMDVPVPDPGDLRRRRSEVTNKKIKVKDSR